MSVVTAFPMSYAIFMSYLIKIHTAACIHLPNDLKWLCNHDQLPIGHQLHTYLVIITYSINQIASLIVRHVINVTKTVRMFEFFFCQRSLCIFHFFFVIEIQIFVEISNNFSPQIQFPSWWIPWVQVILSWPTPLHMRSSCPIPNCFWCPQDPKE